MGQTKTCPFTLKTLKAYPAFTVLPPELQAHALDLFTDKKFNHTGNLKRAANTFLMFRRVRSVEISSQHKLTSGSNKGPTQEHVSPQLKTEWEKISKQERQAYELQAKAAGTELLDLFPHYEYNPISPTWWNALNKDGKKAFFFETMVRICKAMVYPNYKWPGYIAIQQWAQLPENKDNIIQDKLLVALGVVKEPEATPRHAARGSSVQTPPQSTSASPKHVASHPYKSSRPQPLQQGTSWLDDLKSQLVYLGPRAPGGAERSIELITPRPKGASFPVYVEIEIPLQVPQHIANIMKHADGLIPETALILRDYTLPKYARTAPPHTETSLHYIPQPSILQVPRPIYSPLAGSSTSSIPGATSSGSPITPVPLHGGCDATYWNQPPLAMPSGINGGHACPSFPATVALTQSHFSQVPQAHPNLREMQLSSITSGNVYQNGDPSAWATSLLMNSYDEPQIQLSDLNSWIADLNSPQPKPVPNLTPESKFLMDWCAKALEDSAVSAMLQQAAEAINL